MAKSPKLPRYVPRNVALRRVIAALIDGGMFFTPMIGIGLMTALTYDTLDSAQRAEALRAFWGATFWAVFLWPAYQVGMMRWKSATLGKIIMHIRVVKENGSPKIGIPTGAMREFSRMFLLALGLSLGAVGLGLFVALMLAPVLVRADGRLTYDLIAGTKVVGYEADRSFHKRRKSSSKQRAPKSK